MSRLTTKNRDYWDVEHAQLKDGIPSKWTHSQRKEVSDKYYICYKEKFNRVLELAEENQALKDRWQKLKELLEEDMKHNSKEHDESFCSAFQHYSATENWVLDRMKELEEEE